MKLTDLYLKPEGLEEVVAGFLRKWDKPIGQHGTAERAIFEMKFRDYISKASANHAVEKVVEEILRLDEHRSGFIGFRDNVIKLCEALKKLVEETKGGKEQD